MHHGVTHLHACWETVDENTARLFLHGLDQTLGNCQVLCFQMNLRGELPFNGALFTLRP